MTSREHGSILPNLLPANSDFAKRIEAASLARTTSSLLPSSPSSAPPSIFQSANPPHLEPAPIFPSGCRIMTEEERRRLPSSAMGSETARPISGVDNGRLRNSNDYARRHPSENREEWLDIQFEDDRHDVPSPSFEFDIGSDWGEDEDEDDGNLTSETAKSAERKKSAIKSHTQNDGRTTKRWRERFMELQEFQMRFGHCSVSATTDNRDFLKLLQWVKRQRYHYKLRLSGRTDIMPDEHMMLLESIGFVWNTHSATWESKFRQLRAFYDANGHSNVPRRYPTDPSLSQWVKRQRHLYVSRELDASRIAKLETIEFIWNLRSARRSQKTCLDEEEDDDCIAGQYDDSSFNAGKNASPR